MNLKLAGPGLPTTYLGYLELGHSDDLNLRVQELLGLPAAIVYNSQMNWTRCTFDISSLVQEVLQVTARKRWLKVMKQSSMFIN
jgi:hypothetical protein